MIISLYTLIVHCFKENSFHVIVKLDKVLVKFDTCYDKEGHWLTNDLLNAPGGRQHLPHYRISTYPSNSLSILYQFGSIFYSDNCGKIIFTCDNCSLEKS